jgi:PAS domain S-box-containing protein
VGHALAVVVFALGAGAVYGFVRRAARDEACGRFAEEALHGCEERFRAVFEVAPSGVVLLDRRGRILDANPAYLRLTGYSIEELCQQPNSFALYHVAERAAAEAHFEAIVEGEQLRASPSEWRLVCRDGAEVRVRHVAAALRDEQGRFAYAVAMIEDISAARRAEERLRQAHTTEVVGQLAAGVAHEFNNLLQIILGYTGEALDGISEQDPRHNALVQVEKATRRAAKLTRQLLAVGRKQFLQPEDLDANALLRELKTMVVSLAAPPVTVELRLCPGPCPIHVDRAQVEQAVLSLCLNARDAMPSGGRLILSTEILDFAEEYCGDYGYALPGRYVALRVTDTGAGLDGPSLDRVFEPFFSVREPTEGLNLGLLAVSGIASQHGGTVIAVSKPGHGSTFSILIPCNRGHGLPPRTAAGSTTAGHRCQTTMLSTRGQPEGSARPVFEAQGRLSAGPTQPTSATTDGRTHGLRAQGRSCG